MVIFYMKWKKYNEIQLTKNKIDLNNRKLTNHPSSPDKCSHIVTFISLILLIDFSVAHLILK